jgi:hypothetical protein
LISPELIYSAAEDSARWPQFLERLAGAVSGSAMINARSRFRQRAARVEAGVNVDPT